MYSRFETSSEFELQLSRLQNYLPRLGFIGVTCQYSSLVVHSTVTFSAPFLTCWFCMVWTVLFFPLYSLVSLLYSCFKKKNVRPLLGEALTKFQEAGLSKGKRDTWQDVCGEIHLLQVYFCHGVFSSVSCRSSPTISTSPPSSTSTALSSLRSSPPTPRSSIFYPG